MEPEFTFQIYVALECGQSRSLPDYGDRRHPSYGYLPLCKEAPTFTTLQAFECQIWVTWAVYHLWQSTAGSGYTAGIWWERKEGRGNSAWHSDWDLYMEKAISALKDGVSALFTGFPREVSSTAWENPRADSSSCLPIHYSAAVLDTQSEEEQCLVFESQDDRSLRNTVAS